MTGSDRLVTRYYAFRATNSAGFYLPVAVLYLQDQGFGLDFVGFAYAVYAFGTLAAELPSGYVGDLLGRRASLAVGAGLRVVVLAAYPLVDAPTAYLGLHLVWATGRAFRSGTQDAWLYELLAASLDEDRFARVEGRGSTVKLATSAGAAVVGALLYGIDPAYPFHANAALIALGVPLLYTFPGVPRTEDGATGGDGSEVFTVGDALRVLRLQAGRPAIRWLVAYAAMFNALFVVTRIYEQPALDAVGVPVAGLGVLYAAFKLFSAGAAATVGPLNDRFGSRGVFAALAPVYGLAYAGVAVVPELVVPVLFLNRGLATVARPVRNQYLNDRLAGVGRATVLSGAAMVLALFGGVARLAVGTVAESLGPIGLLPWTGVPLAVAAGVLWVLASPVRDAGPRRAGSDAAAAAD